MGLDDEDFNFRSIGSLHPRALGGTEIYFIGHFVVEMRQALRRRGFVVSQVHRKNFNWVADGTPGVEDTAVVMREFERVDGPVHQHLLNGAGVEGHAEDGIVAFDGSGKVEGFRVRGPLERVDPIAEGLGEHARCAAGAIIDGQTKEVRFIAGLLLQLIGNVFSVRRVFRMTVEGGIRSGDVARRLITSERDDPHVAVCGRSEIAVMIRVEGEFCAIWREIVLQGSAQLERRRIEVTWRQVAHRTAGSVGQQDVGTLTVFPLRPVAVEQRIGQMSVERALAPALVELFVTGIVGAAFRIDVARKRDPSSVR